MFTTQTRYVNSSMAIAVNQCHGFKPTIHNRRCRLRSFPHPDISPLDLDPLNLTRPLNLTPPTSPINIHRSFSSPCWTSSPINGDEASSGRNINPRLDVIGGHGNRALRALVVEATVAMASGMQLIPFPAGGPGGTYCLRNRAGENLAVVKPIMEDVHLSLSGPDSFRRGCMVGRRPRLLRHPIRAADTGMSEVAAYLLDHGGFSGVPPTALIKVTHPVLPISTTSPGPGTTTTPPPPWKIASIQRFVAHDYDAGDVGPSRFSVSSVHRIGILDVRLLNIDRHTGNILVKNHRSGGRGSTGCCYHGYAGDDCELVPVDHELCLPERLDDPYFEWLHWPQASVPFSESEAEYISSLDPLRDAELLRAELPMLKEASIRILVLCTVFLKRAAEAGLCLADIGGMMTRETIIRGLQPRGSSQLEALCTRAQVGMAKIFMTRIGNEMVGGVGDGEDDLVPFDMELAGDLDGADQGTAELPGHFLRGKPPKVPKTNTSLSTKATGGDYSNRRSSVNLQLSYPSSGGKKLYGGDEGGGGGGEYRSSRRRRGDSKEYRSVGRGEPTKNNNNNNNISNGGGGRFMSKSVSFCVSRNNGQEEAFDSENSGISFGGLSEGEWKLFMQVFEELLPSAFESRMGLGAASEA